MKKMSSLAGYGYDNYVPFAKKRIEMKLSIQGWVE